MLAGCLAAKTFLLALAANLIPKLIERNRTVLEN
jgi:hypothetical protein